MAVADQEIADALWRSFLGRLPRDVVHELITDGQRTDYPAGSVIYREGEAAREVLVVRGLLRVFMTSPDGRQVTVRYAREADVLGIAVMVGGPANVRVQTITDSSLFSIDGRRLTEAARRDARVALALAEELNRRLYEALQQTAINTFGSVKQRVAAALLDLASAQQRPQDRLVAQVSQQELADAVGSVREVVARALRDFRLAGLVATAPDSVLIVDPARLHDQCW
jgi:CRP/FNR family transcriptional regulator, cyclic AMP receptor protein